MTFKLFGHDVSASKAFRDVGKTAAGVATGMGGAFAASKVVDFGKQSLNAFSDLGSETLKLQRYMGGSAEDASRLAHAFTMSGVNSETSAKGIGILEKHLAANDKAAKALGISFQDVDGKVRPMGELMPEIAEKFKNMPAGAEKSALAMKLFGKNGMAMLPFLNRGAAGVKDLMAESDKLGTTLSGKDLDSVKANTAAKRKFGEALKGLQVTIGKELYPVLTKFATYMTEHLVPAFRSAVDWIKQNKDWLVPLAAAIGGIVVAMKAWNIALKAYNVITGIVKVATIAWTAVQWALNAAMSANPIGLIIIAIVAIVAAIVLAYKKFSWFHKFVDAVWQGIQKVIHAVVKWFMDNAWPIIKRVIGWIVEYYKFLWKIISTVFKWIWNVISGFIQFWRDHVWPIIKRVIDWIIGYYKTMHAAIMTVFGWIMKVINWFKDRFREFSATINTVLGWIRDGFHKVWEKVRDVWDAVWSKVVWVRDKLQGAADAIKGFFSGIWDGIKEKAGAAFNWVREQWNRYLGGKGFHFPGTNIGLTIPMLAAGGIATRPTLAMIGEAGPEAVVPLSRGKDYLGSAGTEVHVHVSGSIFATKEQMAREVVAALQNAKNRGLQLGLAG